MSRKVNRHGRSTRQRASNAQPCPRVQVLHVQPLAGYIRATLGIYTPALVRTPDGRIHKI